jgi:hypothetical protein
MSTPTSEQRTPKCTAAQRKAKQQELATKRQQQMAVLNGVVVPAAFKMPEACAYLGGLSQSTLRRMVDRRLIEPNRSTRHWIFLRSDLDRLLEEGKLGGRKTGAANGDCEH